MEVTNGAFPRPQTILKQLEEWHVILSRDQLGETLRAAPTQPQAAQAQCVSLIINIFSFILRNLKWFKLRNMKLHVLRFSYYEMGLK